MSFDGKIYKISRALDALPNRLAARAVLFSKNRFRQENWVDTSVEPWKKRNSIPGESKKRARRGILRDTGRLMRSIRKIYVSRQMIIIGTDVPYAQVHNEGFKGTVNVPSFKRKRPDRSNKKGDITVKAHTKQLDITKRQFMGESQALLNRLEKMVLKDITNAIK